MNYAPLNWTSVCFEEEEEEEGFSLFLSYTRLIHDISFEF